jgi:hypothetical protein
VTEFLTSLLAKALTSLLQTIVTELAMMLVRASFARYGRVSPAMAF